MLNPDSRRRHVRHKDAAIPSAFFALNAFERFLRSLPTTHRCLFAKRLERIANGHLGDAHPCWSKSPLPIFEIRIFARPGLRAYFAEVGGVRVLLCGGTKGSQRADIEKACRLLREFLSTAAAPQDGVAAQQFAR